MKVLFPLMNGSDTLRIQDKFRRKVVHILEIYTARDLISHVQGEAILPLSPEFSHIIQFREESME